MEREELIRRLEDLSRRRDRSGCMTHSRFLTEEEQALTLQWGAGREGAPVLFGGREGCERRMAFFLPEWEQEGEALMAEEIACVALRGDLGRLTHRDYLGAVLALGLTRDALGDILPGEKTAYIFCTPAAAGAMAAPILLASLIPRSVIFPIVKADTYGIFSICFPIISAPLPVTVH